MDTEVLVATTLTHDMIDDGESMLESMCRTGSEALAAYWQYHVEAKEWRLHVTPYERDEDELFHGIRQVLRAIDSVPRLEQELGLLRLQIRSPNDLLYRSVRDQVSPEMRGQAHWVGPELYCYCIS
jgi:hypothetical protein